MLYLRIFCVLVGESMCVCVELLLRCCSAIFPTHTPSPFVCESSKFLFQAASGSVALVVAQLRSGNC